MFCDDMMSYFGCAHYPGSITDFVAKKNDKIRKSLIFENAANLSLS
jgi:hypothetical protein